MALNREGLDLCGELIAFLDSGVCSKAELRQFLDDAPIFFRIEVDGAPTPHTGHLISAVKPDERLRTFVTALRIRAAKNNADALEKKP